MRTNIVGRPARQRGFTVIEALIALAVMAFGMLALSGMQTSLSRNADVAKQRSEAVRLAQARIENMRSFTGISTGAINWNGLDALANDSSTTNTTYTIASTMGGVDTDSLRTVNVTVSWNDRTGAAQSVSMSSVISQTDPRDPGFIGNPLPLNTPLKRPKNRDINIPIPALSLGNGTSSFQFSATYVVIFSDISGNVVQICNPNVANATVAQILASNCVSFTGYIVAGYVSTPLAAAAAYPTGVNTSGVVRNTALVGQPITCQFGTATDQNNGAVINNYKYYLCVVPLDTPFMWGGTIKLAGVPIDDKYIVCRFQYVQTNVTANERNVQPYVNVNKSMDQQNYLVTTTNDANPTDASCPGSMNVAGISAGVLHQNCRSNNPNRATDCPAV
jgi:prepilin-type N-terminal cleavage/methylation domain-containing protein